MSTYLHLHNALTEERIRRYHEQFDPEDRHDDTGRMVLAAVITAALCGFMLGLVCGLAVGAMG